MTGDFDIQLDRSRRLMTVRMSGFYTLDDVRRYASAIAAATVQLGGAPDEQRMINDISEMNIQSQEIVGAFRQFMSDPRYGRRRVGFVVASTLARKQLMRVIGARHVRIFTSAAAAEAWLFGEEQAAA